MTGSLLHFYDFVVEAGVRSVRGVGIEVFEELLM